MDIFYPDSEDEAVGPDGMNLGRYSSYAEYLQSDEWRALRTAVFTRDLDKCIDCGAQATEVHHRNYPGHVADTTEDDLVSLCRPCHELRPRTGSPMGATEYGEMTGVSLIEDDEAEDWTKEEIP